MDLDGDLERDGDDNLGVGLDLLLGLDLLFDLDLDFETDSDLDFDLYRMLLTSCTNLVSLSLSANSCRRLEAPSATHFACESCFSSFTLLVTVSILFFAGTVGDFELLSIFGSFAGGVSSSSSLLSHFDFVTCA